MLKIGQSRDRLILNMGIPIPGEDHLYIEMGFKYVVTYVLYGESWRPDILYMFYMETHGDQICCCICFIWRIMATRYLVVYLLYGESLRPNILLHMLHLLIHWSWWCHYAVLRIKIMCELSWWTILLLTGLLNSPYFSHSCKNWEINDKITLFMNT